MSVPVGRVTAERPDSEEAACVNCGASLAGPYCAQCGERRAEPDDLTLGSYLREAAGEATSLDGKLYRSFWLLVRRPGLLTREYVAGRRSAFLRPIKIFLLANVVYFLIQPHTGYSGYNTGLESQTTRQLYSNALGLESLVESRVAELGIDAATYARLFDQQSAIYAKSLVIALIPLLSLWLSLILWRQRRPFVEHVVFATHYVAFELLFVSSLFLFLWQRILFGLRNALLDAGVDPVAALMGGPGELLIVLLVELPSWFIIVPYFFFAGRRAYGLTRDTAVAFTVAMLLIEMPFLLLYRLMLFWLTYWSVG